MSKRTILTVDDESIILLGNEALITSLGHDALTATEVNSALEQIATNPAIDILMTDFEMPNGSGPDLALAARKLRPDLGIILVTGHLDIEAHLEPGWGKLLKPFTVDQLALVLSDLRP